MSRLRFAILTGLSLIPTCAATRALPAQTPEITETTPVSPATLRQWLHGDDPRLIAWAADFAVRTHNQELLTEIPPLLEHWHRLRIIKTGEAYSDERRALQSLLDALIQAQIQVTTSTIRAIADEFPAQAIILIVRMDPASSRPLLEEWSQRPTAEYPGALLARVASMMLSLAPQPPFVSRVLSESQNTLNVWISSGTEGRGVGMSTACGDSFGTKLEAGWPRVYAYDLVESDAEPKAAQLVELDVDVIAYRRFEENRPWGSCYGIQPLNAMTRYKLILHWLKATSASMRWHPTDDVWIEWTNQADYEQQLGHLVEDQRRKLAETVLELTRKGLLEPSYPSSQGPRLIVTIKCLLDPCPIKDLTTEP
jgi:hypothetical protein